MRHEADYEDSLYMDPMPYAGDCIIFQARPSHPPYQVMTQRPDVRPYPERVEEEIAELRTETAALRQRVTLLEAAARWQYDQ